MFLLATENDFYMNVSGGVRESIYVFSLCVSLSIIVPIDL